MSTVPEDIVAVHMGMKVCGLCITDQCFPDSLVPADVNEIIRVATESRAEIDEADEGGRRKNLIVISRYAMTMTYDR